MLGVTKRGQAITTSVAKKDRRAKPKAHLLTLAAAAFTIAAGRTTTLQIRIDRVGRALLRAHREGLRVVASIAPRPKPITTDITLKLAAKPKSKRRR